MSVKNLVQCPLITPVSSTATELLLGAVSAPYSLPPLDGGILVIADSVSKPTFVEFIKYTHRIDNVLYGVSRGQEETAARGWSGVTFVYQALTADQYTSELASKEPVIPPGTAAQYWRGDKSFQDLATAIRAANLTGFSTATNSPVVSTDTLLAALGKLQAQVSARLLSTANAVSATKLQTARTISVAGDATGSLTFDGTANVSMDVTLQPSGVTAGTYTKLTVDSKGRVTGGTILLVSDVPTLNQDTTGNAGTATKLQTSRTINGVPFDGTANITVADGTKEPAFAAGTTAQYRRGDKTWQDLATAVRAAVLTGLSTATSTAVAATDSVLAAIGKLQAQITGLDTSKLDAADNAVSASKLATARTINGVPFDGTVNITVADGTKLPLTGGTMTGVTTHEAGAVQSISHRWQSGGVMRWQMGREADGNTFQLWHYNTSGAFLRAFSFNGSTGVLSAAGFSGSGANLTEIPAANLTGIVPNASLSGAYTGVSIDGNAGSATKLATARTINGVSFDGTANITVTAAANGGTSAACSGNAATATTLQTARTINGVSFNGSTNITIEDATKLPTTGGSLTGVLRLVDGTAAAPGLTFVNDTDTGLYRVGTNALGITTGGSVAVDFDAVGNTNVYGRLRSAGNLSSAAWTTTGCSFDLAAATFTDTSSAAAAVVALRAAATVNTPTYASTNAITVSDASTFYVAGRPTAGTNTTITRGWAIWVNSGDSRFGGNVTSTGNISQTSDIRVKEEIEEIPDALAKVVQLRGVTYKRKDTGERQTGVIAQEVQAVLPEAVIEGNEHLSVAYGNMVGLLIESIKELNGKVDSLQAEVTELRRAA